MLFHRRDVCGVLAQRQQPAVDFGVQRLHPAIHHFRKPGDVGDVEDIYARFAQRVGRAAGADDLNAETFQLLREIDNTGLVRNTDERAPNLAEPCILFFNHVIVCEREGVSSPNH